MAVAVAGVGIVVAGVGIVVAGVGIVVAGVGIVVAGVGIAAARDLTLQPGDRRQAVLSFWLYGAKGSVIPLWSWAIIMELLRACGRTFLGSEICE